MAVEREIEIESSGRSGSIWYVEGPAKIRFDWEFGGTCVALIWGDSLRHLRDSGSITADRARDILNFVARRAVAEKAPNCRFELDELRCEITIL
jgi:hypothetical protein